MPLSHHCLFCLVFAIGGHLTKSTVRTERDFPFFVPLKAGRLGQQPFLFER
jgi:hypothetical protein